MSLCRSALELGFSGGEVLSVNGQREADSQFLGAHNNLLREMPWSRTDVNERACGRPEDP